MLERKSVFTFGLAPSLQCDFSFSPTNAHYFVAQKMELRYTKWWRELTFYPIGDITEGFPFHLHKIGRGLSLTLAYRDSEEWEVVNLSASLQAKGG